MRSSSWTEDGGRKRVGRLSWQDDPAAPWSYELHGACGSGPGWGRKHLGRRLLPVTRTMWRRSQFSPMPWLFQLVDPGDDDAAGWERVRECVGEHLLQLALNADIGRVTRSAALDALAALQPGGDGSIARALGKLTGDDALGGRARRAQRALKAKDRTTDGELAIDDAWRTFWASLDDAGPDAG